MHVLFHSVVTIRFGGAILSDQRISEDAGILDPSSLYIERDGDTEQTLTIRLQFSDYEATVGKKYIFTARLVSMILYLCATT